MKQKGELYYFTQKQFITISIIKLNFVHAVSSLGGSLLLRNFFMEVL